MKVHHLAVPLAALAITATACGGGSDAQDKPSADRTLTVWLMDGDLTDTTVAAINKAFTQATGARVNVQIQQWDDINTKITTALAQSDPPDVLDLGNTDVPLFAANGGLSDLTRHRAELSGGQTWLPGLVGPATVDGKTYAAPLFAGNRAVIYNKDIWAKAGVTRPPATLTEFAADLDKIKKAHGDGAADFSALYLPGREWHSAVQFVWDAGGQLASQSGGRWQGALESAQAQRGLQAWKNFQNSYSVPASRNVDNVTPDQRALFGQGRAAAIVDTSISQIVKAHPTMKNRIGTFPFPSATPGKSQPVFLGGSDLAIAAKSRNQALALAWLKAATSPGIQKNDIVGVDGWTPISTQLIDQTRGGLAPTAAAFLTAAANSVATPATPGWATVETDKSINGFFADIATGRTSTAEAARSFDGHLDQALNTSGQ
ncbi:extracellular solute-binding protein [Actinomadura opuntiae]|uniref:extracellular solute-binding protein n=1 Tax=Actinomadura sp. OS1-43 TaxID=604315 RepID=UPI00255B3C20|nr:extracellular solute-binding protein [Actinomadura sp. OS1-43]MDL4818489.1 extracellular solute-binding protein [Actinomadura sp. OS1-43]